MRLLFLLVENVRRTGSELTDRIPKGYGGNLRKQRIKSLCDNTTDQKRPSKNHLAGIKADG